MNCLRALKGRRNGLARCAVLVGLLLAPLMSVAGTYSGRPSTVTVVGDVRNGTPDGGVPEDLTVALHVFSGTAERSVHTTTLGSDRTFEFRDVEVEEGQTLVVRVVYGGVTYVSDFWTVEAGQREAEVPVFIYETTEDSEQVAVGQLHVFVDRRGEQVQIGQYCLISNKGTRTYVGLPGSVTGTRETWAVELPEGAENLQVDGGNLGGRFIALEDGFADTRAVPPGAMSVEASFSYELRHRERLLVEQVFDVPVNSVVLVVSGQDLALEGAVLSPEGALETQNGPAEAYVAGPLAAGEPLRFLIVSTEADASRTLLAGPVDGLAVGLMALGVAGVAVYWLLRPVSPGPVPAQACPGVEAIAALDRDFDRGNMPETMYRERRRALKERVRDSLLDARR